MAIVNAYNRTQISEFLDTKVDDIELEAEKIPLNPAILAKFNSSVFGTAMESISATVARQLSASSFDAAVRTITSTLAQKANAIDVNASLATKFSITQANNVVNLKADTLLVNSQLAFKLMFLA